MIRRRRMAKGLSVRALGEILGVTGSAVSQWENGGNITWQNRVALSDALGISVADFLPDADTEREVTAQTPRERLLLQRFRLVPERLQEAYLNMLIVQGERLEEDGQTPTEKR